MLSSMKASNAETHPFTLYSIFGPIGYFKALEEEGHAMRMGHAKVNFNRKSG